jgi:carbonic anhydrase
MLRFAWILPWLALGLGCDKLAPKEEAIEAEDDSAEHDDAHASKKGDKDKHGKDDKAGEKAGAHADRGTDAHAKAPFPMPTDGSSPRFGMPFAWEVSKDEPLAKARSFMIELMRDNGRKTALGAKHFAPFSNGQTPRATVVTCADSRVQSDAWDASPENDDFTVRNVGNQVTNALGSVEYGVEHLNTPILLILGHTGCGAVKAALDKPADLSEPLKKELAALKLPEMREGASEKDAWTDAVIANVNHQVEVALEHFGARTAAGQVTIVGGVYDFRNDLGQGAGKLVIVNVNGNDEKERIAAFEKALRSGAGAEGPSDAAVDDRVEDLLRRRPNLVAREEHAVHAPAPHEPAPHEH